jgi:hypothetical protein
MVTSITLDPEENVFVADFYNNCIQKFAADLLNHRVSKWAPTP